MPTPTVEAALHRIADGATAQALEGRALDFKRPMRSRDDTAKDMAEAAACFANAVGGSVVLGVADRISGPDAFVGTDIQPQWLARRIYELTAPSLTVEVSDFRYADVTLIEIRVPIGVEVHLVNGRATARRDDGCLQMTSTDIARLADERRGVDWSAAETDHLVSMASPVAMAQARALLRQHQDPQRRSYATYDDADLLRALGVATADGRLLNAGLVLFCDPDPASPVEELLVYQHRRSPGGEPAEIARLSRPLISAYLRIQELIDARVDKSPLLLPDGQQVYLADLPEAAVREAVANAVIHRDYRLTGPVHVEHAPTQLVVTSPGPLVQGVTVDNILSTPSRPRNLRLTAAVRILGLAEQAGVGVERMYREMIRVGHQPPQIQESWGTVRVSLLGGAPNKAIARYVASLPEEYADDADVMLVLFSLLSKRTVTAEQLMPVLQKPIDEVAGVLRKLDGDDIAMVEPTRETIRRRYATYRLREHVIRELGAAVSYRRRTQDDIDRKVIEAVQEIGQITGRMVQLLLDVDGSRASRILADLVDRQILMKTSHQQRGPGVKYGPGSQFPLRKGRRGLKSTQPKPNRAAGDDQPEQQELFPDDA